MIGGTHEISTEMENKILRHFCSKQFNTVVTHEYVICGFNSLNKKPIIWVGYELRGKMDPSLQVALLVLVFKTFGNCV